MVGGWSNPPQITSWTMTEDGVGWRGTTIIFPKMEWNETSFVPGDGTATGCFCHLILTGLNLAHFVNFCAEAKVTGLGPPITGLLGNPRIARDFTSFLLTLEKDPKGPPRGLIPVYLYYFFSILK
ncbi:MAG: hypothetical protein CM15mP129_00390 [Chloroflexota bacterium]|nr:MAG: hypothetical protein CM15mP129_00390 [Chloroflexota bacterium]